MSCMGSIPIGTTNQSLNIMISTIKTTLKGIRIMLGIPDNASIEETDEMGLGEGIGFLEEHLYDLKIYLESFGCKVDELVSISGSFQMCNGLRVDSTGSLLSVDKVGSAAKIFLKYQTFIHDHQFGGFSHKPTPLTD